MSRKISGGGDVVIFDSMSIATSPVSPNAVVWYRFGRYSIPHRKISSGVNVERYALILARSDWLRGSASGLGRSRAEVEAIGAVT